MQFLREFIPPTKQNPANKTKCWRNSRIPIFSTTGLLRSKALCLAKAKAYTFFLTNFFPKNRQISLFELQSINVAVKVGRNKTIKPVLNRPFYQY